MLGVALGVSQVRIANFGLCGKFSDITRNVSHSLENIRYSTWQYGTGKIK
jgi:hypothetical protein